MFNRAWKSRGGTSQACAHFLSVSRLPYAADYTATLLPYRSSSATCVLRNISKGPKQQQAQYCARRGLQRTFQLPPHTVSVQMSGSRSMDVVVHGAPLGNGDGRKRRVGANVFGTI